MHERGRAFNIFNALLPHTVAAIYSRPIHTSAHNVVAHFDNRRLLMMKGAKERISWPTRGGAQPINRWPAE